MNLAIDIGNSTTNAAVFNCSDIVAQVRANSMVELSKFINDFEITTSAVSNVNHEDQIPQFIRELNPIFVDHNTLLPIKINYHTPQTLGSDRICVAVGGHALYPNNTVLTIDLGTCIKYELITSAGIYHGGNIAPGLKMRFRSLHEGTARLPLISATERVSDFGRSTQEAINNGVLLGIECEMEAMIGRTTALFPDLITIITGGDSAYFENALKTPIFAHPLLVLQGLNEIIQFNLPNKP